MTEVIEGSHESAGRAEIISWINRGLIVFSTVLAVAGLLWLSRRGPQAHPNVIVCAWTRRVQWRGDWISFEEFLARRFNMRCTHGICREAADKMKLEMDNAPAPAALTDQ